MHAAVRAVGGQGSVNVRAAQPSSHDRLIVTQQLCIAACLCDLSL